MSTQDEFDKKCRDEWEALIDQWVHNEVDRKMLKRKYLDGICFEPLAEEFELSVQHTRTIVDNAKSKIEKILKKSVIFK